MTARTAATILLGLCLACAPARYVAVPEAQFRTEQTPADRISLPLAEAQEQRLRKFLASGGNTDAIGHDTPDPSLRTRYDGLLARLRLPLTGDELLEQHTLKQWLGDKPLRQIVDARSDRPPIIGPIALADDRFWWIFYHRAEKVTGLMVVRRIQRKPVR